MAFVLEPKTADEYLHCVTVLSKNRLTWTRLDSRQDREPQNDIDQRQLALVWSLAQGRRLTLPVLKSLNPHTLKYMLNAWEHVNLIHEILTSALEDLREVPSEYVDLAARASACMRQLEGADADLVDTGEDRGDAEEDEDVDVETEARKDMEECLA